MDGNLALVRSSGGYPCVQGVAFVYIEGRPALTKDLLVPCLYRAVDCLCLVVVPGLLNSDYVKLLAVV